MQIIHHIRDVLQFEMSAAGIFLLRLVLAAILGGAIGLERSSSIGPPG
jgi:uncharacterized membrane protein YhiD involved in acid resistance